MRGRWDLVNDAMYQALSGITLAEMRDASVPRAFRLATSRITRCPCPLNTRTVEHAAPVEHAAE